MFESDDWTAEDLSNDLDEKTIQSHSLCESEEQTSFVKRRKVDNSKASTSSLNVSELRSDVAANAESDNLPYKSQKSSRRNLLLDIFQKNFSQEISDFIKSTNQNSTNVERDQQCLQYSKISTTVNTIEHKELKQKNQVKSTDKVDLSTKIKLHRIFPGPAGLITDKKKNDIPIESYLNHTKALETKTVMKNENAISQSQDEKNLSDKTAWNFLLNDLPDNFLKGHSISVIKSKANASNCNSMKVPFIAGALEYIDHNQNNPFIILKDSTGSIEGTIHHEILSNYPNVLEPNVVIFLNDVGLLKTTTYVVTNKYHILVSQVNLLAVYSNKGQLVNTSRMKNVLSNISNIELNIDCDMSISKHRTDSKTDGLAKYEKHKQLVTNDNEACKVMDEVNNCFDQLIDIDDSNMDDVLCTIDCEFLSLGKENRPIGLSCETVSQDKKIQCSESQMRNANHTKSAKIESVVSFDMKQQNLQKCVTSVNATCHSRENYSLSNDSIAHVRKAHKDSSTNIKSIPAIKQNSQNSDISVNHFTGDNEYDSDDEILSQLDVDNVL